ncbi:reverse transcriptase [Gossypium australe]|uniref:Reverse transcriptase n=1 Tax=Gossypium australe TaxID=47621 RepID=A0A5B6VBL1_9ROSI|nr:reverse transcriptase [Gossypium australe]
MFLNSKHHSLSSDEEYHGKSMASGERCSNSRSWGKAFSVPILSCYGYGSCLKRIPVDVQQTSSAPSQDSKGGGSFESFFNLYASMGHSDSYCKAKMLLGMEVVDMGWDLSLKAQSKRAMAINSIWLREDRDDGNNASGRNRQLAEKRTWGVSTKSEIGVSIDPVLGINLEGSHPNSSQQGRNLIAKQTLTAMEHELEERVLIRVDPDGSKGGLCLAWRGEISISVQSFSKSHIDALVNAQNNEQRWRFTGFYGSPYAQEREESWNLLKSLRGNVDQSWFVCGDFNEIMYGFEKKGGLPREERRMEAFRNALENCQLIDVGDLVQKLEYLKMGLRRWATRIGMSKNRKKKVLTSKLFTLMEAERTDDNLAEMIDTKVQLNFEIDKYERYWEQRDRDLFKAGQKGHYEHLLTGVEQCIFEEDNRGLTKPFIKEEIWDALKSMGATKAPEGLSSLMRLAQREENFRGLKAGTFRQLRDYCKMGYAGALVKETESLFGMTVGSQVSDEENILASLQILIFHGSSTNPLLIYGTGLPGFLTGETVSNVDLSAALYGLHGTPGISMYMKGKTITGRDLSKKVQSYVAEIDRSKEEEHTCVDNKWQRQNTRETEATIFFDIAYDSKNAISASGLVVKGKIDEWLASKSVIHSAIASPFMAEAHAGLQAIKLGINLGFRSISILGDSKTVIKKCNSTDRNNVEERRMGYEIRTEGRKPVETWRGRVSRFQNLLGNAIELNGWYGK